MALDRINDFIVENSLSPVKKQDLETMIAQKVISAREQRPSMTAAAIDKNCHAAFVFKGIRAQGHQKFRAYIDDLLSVPRPPVLNPCL